MSTQARLRLAAYAVLSLLAWPAAASSQASHQDTMKPAFVLKGASMTEAQCAALSESVWVARSGQGDCIRYFSGGLGDKNQKAIVYFHGDRLWRRWNRDFTVTREHKVIGYRDNDPARLKAEMRAIAASAGRPAIFIARPGVYGSSGQHANRRQVREVELMDGALDEIKRRHRIGRFVLAGQSGGGHVVGAMLARRQDVECAVLTSAVVAVRARVEARRWPADVTGARTFFDPIEHVQEIKADPALRIFVVGDPRDTNVPFATQALYHEALKSRGLDAYLLKASGRGQERHGLDRWAKQIAIWCAQGLATHDIVRQVKPDDGLVETHKE
ncbi:MAG TPA: prolyl oligopeptidase family serine peptidase [Hyphomicrobiaceae bacterium]|jgi:pimeloyl-ACP methyl ester carboxylesterase